MSVSTTWPLSPPPSPTPSTTGTPGELAHITTHVADGIARLISQYQDRPRFAALLTAILTQFQILEDAIWGVFIETALANASGDELDLIGGIVGQPRNGSADPEYIVFISARIKANISNGRMDELLAIAALLMPTSPLIGREYFPSAIVIQADGVTVNSRIVWLDFLKIAAGAAKDLQFGASIESPTNTIKLSSYYGGTARVATQLMGSAAGTYGGGKLSAIYG